MPGYRHKKTADNLNTSPAPKDCRKWSPRALSQAATEFAENGNLMETSRVTGIPHGTLSHHLKLNDGVFVETLQRCREIRSEAQKQTYSRIVDAAQEKTLELIPTVRNAKDVATIAAIATDKLRLAEGQPNRITASAGDIASLAKTFRDLSEQWTEKQAKVVDTQVIDSDTDNT